MADQPEPRDEAPAAADSPEAEVEPAFRVEDRRHGSHAAAEPGDGEAQGRQEPRASAPSIVNEYRERAEAAEARLQEYIEAFKRFRAEQEEVRLRLTRDVDRKTEVRFGELVSQLLDTVDNLELALEHARQTPAAEGLARGIDLARKRFLDTLESHGVERFGQVGVPFDPNEAEALRVDPVAAAADDGAVTEVLRPGYRLAGRVLRAARVAVGRCATD